MASETRAEYMNAQTLATHLGVTERTVRRWIERGELPAERQGRAFAIRREDGERVRLGTFGSRVAAHRSELEHDAAARGEELAVLRGRYMELQERLVRVEQELDAERRRAVRLEIELASRGGHLSNAA